MNENDLTVNTDGGARGNPGPAGIGVLICDKGGKELLRIGKRIGTTTNNIAEYSAILFALNWIKENTKKNSERTINFFLDSQLVVNQLNGIYKIKAGHLREIFLKIKILENEIGGKIIYNFIFREKNTIADFLVNSSF